MDEKLATCSYLERERASEVLCIDHDTLSVTIFRNANNKLVSRKS